MKTEVRGPPPRSCPLLTPRQYSGWGRPSWHLLYKQRIGRVLHIAVGLAERVGDLRRRQRREQLSEVRDRCCGGCPCFKVPPAIAKALKATISSLSKMR